MATTEEISWRANFFSSRRSASAARSTSSSTAKEGTSPRVMSRQNDPGGSRFIGRVDEVALWVARHTGGLHEGLLARIQQRGTSALAAPPVIARPLVAPPRVTRPSGAPLPAPAAPTALPSPPIEKEEP
jgi:hypothetical protein